MKIVCIIPARFQSTRFPGKLLARAQGKTILQRSFECALRCNFDALYVATDDERIVEHVRSFQGEVLWTSPACRNGTERIAEAFRSYEALQKADVIVNIQGDHPSISPDTVGAVVEVLKKDPLALVSTAVSLLQNREEYLSPHMVKCVFDQQGNALYFSRAPIPHNSPEKAYGHIGIYCYKNAFFRTCYAQPPTPLQMAEDLEQLKILEWGYRIKVAIVQEAPLNVDIPQDLVKLEQFLCQNTSS